MSDTGSTVALNPLSVALLSPIRAILITFHFVVLQRKHPFSLVYLTCFGLLWFCFSFQHRSCFLIHFLMKQSSGHCYSDSSLFMSVFLWLAARQKKNYLRLSKCCSQTPSTLEFCFTLKAMSPDCPDIQWKLNNKSDSLDGYFDYLARHQHPTSIPIICFLLLLYWVFFISIFYSSSFILSRVMRKRKVWFCPNVFSVLLYNLTWNNAVVS